MQERHLAGVGYTVNIMHTPCIVITITILLFTAEQEAPSGQACSRTQSWGLRPGLQACVLSPHLKEQQRSLRSIVQGLFMVQLGTRNLWSTCPLTHVSWAAGCFCRGWPGRGEAISTIVIILFATVCRVSGPHQVLAQDCVLALCSLSTGKWVQFL